MSTSIIPTDIVSVFTYRRHRHRAECTCGWEGRRRWFLGAAVVDALTHAYEAGCREDWPLVVDYTRVPDRDAPLRLSTRRLLAGLTAAAVLGVTGVGWAAYAHASPETEFFDALMAGGITIHDAGAAAARGHAICDAMDHANGEVIAQALYAHTSYVEMPSIEVARFWVVTAGIHLCPWQFHPGRRSVVA